MEERLNIAAQAGDIDTLYTQLTENPSLLEIINQVPFSQTPLHIAALAGHTSFLMELLNLKPSLIRKLNSDGYSPIHLASIEGQVEMVKELLEYDQELALIKGREWRTPLHCAVINGKVEVVNELLSNCNSEWLRALTVRKESVLHLALKYDQIGVFEMLLEEVKAKKAEEIVNWKDREGNTILHLAAYRKQFQIIDMLLGSNDFLKTVNIDLKNKSGHTALDVLRQHNISGSDSVEIERILMHFGGENARDIIVPIPTLLPSHRTPSSNMEPVIIMEELFKGLPMEKWAKEIEDSPSETRSTLMVVAVLIASVTFQVALSPPGGFRDRDGVNVIQSALVEGYGVFLVLFSLTNSIGFMTSIAMITVLTRRSPLKALLRMAVLSMVATYICFVFNLDNQNNIVTTIVAISMFTVVLLQWIYMKVRSLKKVFYG